MKTTKISQGTMSIEQFITACSTQHEIDLLIFKAKKHFRHIAEIKKSDINKELLRGYEIGGLTRLEKLFNERVNTHQEGEEYYKLKLKIERVLSELTTN